MCPILDDPHGNNTDATGDAFKTVFVGRLSYAVDEDTLRREFCAFGDVKNVVVVRKSDTGGKGKQDDGTAEEGTNGASEPDGVEDGEDGEIRIETRPPVQNRPARKKPTGKPRGYAFVEFYQQADAKVAVRQGNGMKIAGMRIVVDVERGRTVDKWLPRRLGGGVGNSRPAKPKSVNPGAAAATGARFGDAGYRGSNSRDGAGPPPSYNSSGGRYAERPMDAPIRYGDRDRDRDRHRGDYGGGRERHYGNDRHRERERERERERDYGRDRYDRGGNSSYRDRDRYGGDRDRHDRREYR